MIDEWSSRTNRVTDDVVLLVLCDLNSALQVLGGRQVTAILFCTVTHGNANKTRLKQQASCTFALSMPNTHTHTSSASINPLVAPFDPLPALLDLLDKRLPHVCIELTQITNWCK